MIGLPPCGIDVPVESGRWYLSDNRHIVFEPAVCYLPRFSARDARRSVTHQCHQCRTVNKMSQGNSRLAPLLPQVFSKQAYRLHRCGLPDTYLHDVRNFANSSHMNSSMSMRMCCGDAGDSLTRYQYLSLAYFLSKVMCY